MNIVANFEDDGALPNIYRAYTKTLPYDTFLGGVQPQ